MKKELISLGLSVLTFLSASCSSGTTNQEEPKKGVETPTISPTTPTEGCKMTVTLHNRYQELEKAVGNKTLCELVLKGEVSASDYTFLRGLPAGRLTRLDLSGITNSDFSMGVFKGSHIPEVVLPPMKEIGLWAFQESDVETVVFSDATEVIGIGAFNGCAKLKSVKLPKNLKEVGLSAFEDCVALKGDLIFPDSLEELVANAFYGCTGLDGKLVLGKNFKGSGLSPFAYQNSAGETSFLNFKEVYFRGTEREVFIFGIEAGLFKGTEDVTLYIPTGTRSIFIQSSWHNLKKVVEMPVEKMPSYK